ncbi:MAG TPA: hypothetical protein DCZ62_01740 [Ruminococcus sp.]|nr:hypothetical protein [Ruminococcus sp.]
MTDPVKAFLRSVLFNIIAYFFIKINICALRKEEVYCRYPLFPYAKKLSCKKLLSLPPTASSMIQIISSVQNSTQNAPPNKAVKRTLLAVLRFSGKYGRLNGSLKNTRSTVFAEAYRLPFPLRVVRVKVLGEFVLGSTQDTVTLYASCLRRWPSFWLLSE